MTIFVAVPIVAVVGEPVGYPSHATLATPDYIPMQNVHSARPIIRLTTDSFRRIIPFRNPGVNSR
jgi:hypothetical protein